MISSMQHYLQFRNIKSRFQQAKYTQTMYVKLSKLDCVF